MEKTLFKIPKMDCPAEENLIRIKLDHFPGVKSLEFEIQNRNLTVIHEGNLDGIVFILVIQGALRILKLGK